MYFGCHHSFLSSKGDIELMEVAVSLDAMSATDRKVETAWGSVPWILVFIACNLRDVQWLSWRDLVQPPTRND